MLCHGLSTGGLFIVAGILQERLHTRDMGRMGGLWDTLPRLGGVSLVLAMASLGLPGLGNFVAEFLVLAGAFQVSPGLAIAATIGLVPAAVYALRFVQRIFYGPNVGGWQLPDLAGREVAILVLLIGCLVWLGLFPQPVLDTADPVLRGLQQLATTSLSLGR
jgi:NADH-quinone oxidoreductase subunit M